MPRIQINLIGTSDRVGASWAVTTQWAVSTMPTPAALATALADARNALVASTAFKSGIASNYRLISLHGIAYAIPNGPASFTADASGTPIVGLGTMTPIPLALVVSEQTAAAGGSHRGRSYWPAGGGEPNGQVLTAIASQVRASWLAMHSSLLTALQTMGGAPVHVVFSRKTAEMTPISTIRTGDRIDTARGRYGDTPEAYTSAALPTTLLVGSAPANTNEVSPQAVGLPENATPEEVEARLLELVKQSVPNEGLGPLIELWGFLQTILEARKP